MKKCEVEGRIGETCRRIQGCFQEQMVDFEIEGGGRYDDPDLPSGLSVMRNRIDRTAGCPEQRKLLERIDGELRRRSP